MIINLKSETDLSGFYVVYEGSTYLESPTQRGIAHFSEHLKCKAYEHLRGDFERKGIDWNAYTSSNEIVYHFNGLDEYLAPYRETVVNLLQNFIPTEKQFIDEKRIIIEEYKSCFVDQVQSHYLNLIRKLFNDYDPIGLLEDIENMTYQDMLDFMKIQYEFPSKIINVSKHSEFNFDTKFSSYKIDKEINYSTEDTAVYELNNEFNDKTSILCLSPIIREDFNYLKFLTYMMCDGLESPLYQEIREKRGLTYYVASDMVRIANDGFMYIMVQTSNDKVQELLDTLKLVVDNPDTYLTQERFDIVKEGLIITYKKSEINRHNSVRKYIDPKNWDVSEIINDITLDKVKEIYKKYISYDTLYISNDKNEFVKF